MSRLGQDLNGKNDGGSLPLRLHTVKHPLVARGVLSIPQNDLSIPLN
jgi:hypothetical protein